MPERLDELLLKAVRQLPAPEQDEVLRSLLAGAVLAGPLPSTGTRRLAAPPVEPVQIDLPSGVLPPHQARVDRLFGWPLIAEAPSTEVTSEPETELKVLPVRLPVADYDRLRTFSREHGFSMAVIIRTLVERFLDERAPRPDGQPPA